MTIERRLDEVLRGYHSSFVDKEYAEENDDRDLLMDG